VHTSLPSIFNPHDLQHLHYPCFFSVEEVALREATLRFACTSASHVAVGSSWVKEDVVTKYAVDADRVHVIPFAPPTELYAAVTPETRQTVAQSYNLPDRFVFYPAQTWPHKNHVRLLQAIAYLRHQRGLTVNLVCAGRKNDHFTEIQREIDRLELAPQVQFLGFIPPEALRALYTLAHAVVIPTLFEAGSFPLFEAFAEGIPAACSAITSLPEQAGDGAILFDPRSVEDIASALERVTFDEPLRAGLRIRALARSRLYSWERTARAYRALYRVAAGHALEPDDAPAQSHERPVSPLAEVREISA
jgi:glycosyltransferase involved in cell wall biosynthesis